MNNLVFEIDDISQLALKVMKAILARDKEAARIMQDDSGPRALASALSEFFQVAAAVEADECHLDYVKWEQILKAREYYEDHAVVPPIRKFSKYIAADQKEMFKMWMTGPMKPITKYGGLPKPTGCV